MEKYYKKILAERILINCLCRRAVHISIFVILLIFPIFQSTYAQDQWRVFTTANSPLPTNAIGTIVIDTNNIKWIGTANGMVKIDGNNWQIYDTNNTPLQTNSIYPRDIDEFNNLWVTIPQYGITKFDGSNWTVYDTSNSGLPANGNVNLSVDENNVKWICTPGLIRFDDINWTIYNTTNSGLPHNLVTTIAFENHLKWIGTFSSTGGMAKFNDTNWTIYNTGNSEIPSNMIRNINIDDWGCKWICTYGEGLAKFNSELNVWSIYNPLNSGLPSYYPRSIAFKNGYVKFIGTEGSGIAVYNDTSWQVFNSGNSPLLDDFIGDIKIDKLGNVWIATTYGLAIYNPNGIVGFDLQNLTTPKQFVLHQNYPNPFNPITNIEYQIAKNNLDIKLIIYDITGKEILTLLNQKQNIGRYKVRWNAAEYPSGVYFYKLEVGNYSQTKKMVLIK